MSSRISRLRGGVDVPGADKRWTGKLVEVFGSLDANYQNQITDILGELGKENPERARDIARQLSEFFRGMGQAEDLPSFLARVQDEIQQERNKRMH